jgi:predicted ATPase
MLPMQNPNQQPIVLVITRKLVRQALRMWNRLDRLSKSPLAQLSIVEEQRQNLDYPRSDIGTAQALRTVLDKAIDLLKPLEAVPEPQEKRWREYLIITNQFLQQRSPDIIADELHIDRSTYNHSQAQALDQITSTLLAWEEEVLARPPAKPDATTQQRLFHHGASSLPHIPTPLIGREDDLATVQALLVRDDVRLVTLTGPPGIGKTRLALQVGEEVSVLFPDQVWWIPLAAIDDPDRIVSAMTQTFGLPLDSQRGPQSELTIYLHPKRLLLILDNFEQVVTAAPVIHDLLIACPNLKVLVTSRVRLRLPGEHLVSVLPLALPDAAAMVSTQQISRVAAVSLFLQRAQAINKHFSLTEANACAIAELCIALDGIPLALELAAVRTLLFTPEALLKRLTQRLDLLADVSHAIPSRQHTLRNAIDWSFHLLDLPTQRLFCCLGVFADGMTLEAIETVCVCSGDKPIDVIKLVTALIDASLLQSRVVGGETRFMMLDTIREYALEQLHNSGEVTRIEQQYIMYYLEVAEAVAPQLLGVEQRHWLQFLEHEHDNLRLALRRADNRGDSSILIRLCCALWRFWYIQGHLREGMAWFNQALAHSDVPSVLRASALNYVGLLALLQDEYDSARTYFEEAYLLFHALEDLNGIAQTLAHLGTVAIWQTEYARAISILEEALQLSLQIGDEHGVAMILNNLSLATLNLGNSQRARSLLDESLLRFRVLDYPFGVGIALNLQGRVALAEGDLQSATKLFKESIAILDPLGNVSGVARAETYLGYIACQAEDLMQAYQYLRRGLQLFHSVGDQEGIATALEGLAGVALRTNTAAQAVNFVGCAAALRDVLKSQVVFPTRFLYESYITEARNRLGEENFTTAWRSGYSMNLDQIIADVVEQPNPFWKQ